MKEDLLHHLFLTVVESIDSDEELWEHYKSCLIAHDWQWEESEDPEVQYIGSKEENHILEVRAACTEIDPERARSLFEQHAQPRGW